MRIVFFGTPDFAVATLQAIHEAGYDIAGVVTAPDRPAGRGMQPKMSAVKQYAVSHHLNLAQPEKLKHPDFLAWLSACRADLQVVVAFRMLPEVVWNMPPMGTYNVHASLLPQYRGAAPINWAIMNGEKETGVTIFQLRQEIDTGPVLAKKAIAIEPEDDAGTLHDKLMQLGAKAMVDVLTQLDNGEAMPIAQDTMLEQSTELKTAPKIFTDTCRINFARPASAVLNQIRGLAPYPGAFTHLQDKVLKIYQANMGERHQNQVPGTMESDGKKTLRIAAQDAWISVHELQLQGKKKMAVEDFLRGFRM